MFGLILVVPSYVDRSADHKDLVLMLIWGGLTIVCIVVFCVALMYLLRARRGPRANGGFHGSHSFDGSR